MALDVSVDIGGTLAKLVVLSPANEPSPLPDTNCEKELSFRVLAATGPYDLHFAWWKTTDIDTLVAFLSQLGLKRLSLTGGGAHRFSSQFENAFDVHKVDEMESAARGLSFLFSYSKATHEEFFGNINADASAVSWECAAPPEYPFLLVTVGSGVSMIKILSEQTHEVRQTQAYAINLFRSVSVGRALAVVQR